MVLSTSDETFNEQLQQFRERSGLDLIKSVLIHYLLQTRSYFSTSDVIGFYKHSSSPYLPGKHQFLAWQKKEEAIEKGIKSTVLIPYKLLKLFPL